MAAMKNYFQVTTICNTRASLVQCCHPFPSVKNHHLSTFKGFNISTTSLPTSFSPNSLTGRPLKARVVCKAKEAVDEVQVVTDASWESLVIGSETPVLVDFWAPWCGPCRMIEPIISELAKEYAGKITCYKVNTDECPNIATTYGIRSIPTVLFFKNGEKKESIIGAVPKTTLSNVIEKYIDV